VDFQQQVLPILRDSCLACHNRTKAKAKLVLETPADILKGGDSGLAVVPGKAEQSLMYKAAAHDPSVDSPMPPPDNKVNAPQLGSAQLALLKAWIDQGAKGGVQAAAAIAWKPIPAALQPIYSVAISPDGRFAACGRANEICIYRLPSGQLVTRLADPSLASPGAAHRDMVASLAFSPDGRQLASGSYREVKLWRGSAPEVKFDLPAGPIAASADGKRLAVGGVDGVIQLYAGADGAYLGEISSGSAAIRAISVSADGARVAAVCGPDSVRAWSVASREPLATIRSPSALNAISWLSEQEFAAAADDGIVRVWSLDGTLREFKGHRGILTSLAATSARPTQLISGSTDGTVRVWDLKSSRELRTLQHGAPVLAMAISSDGKHVASAGGGKPVTLWSVDDGKRMEIAPAAPARREPHPPVRAVAFSDDGARIVVARDQTMAIYDAATGDEVARVETVGGAFDSIAFCGENRVAAGSFVSAGHVLDLGGQWKLDRTIGGDSPSSPFADRVTALDFSPDGKLLATGGGEPSRQGEIVFIRPDDGAVVRRLDDVHSDTVFSLRFSPGGRELASGSADKFVRVTEIPIARVLRSFEGHGSHVLGVAWSRDGRTIASAGADNTLRFWDASGAANPLIVADFEKEVTSVSFLAASSQAIVTGGEPRVRIIDASGGNVRSLDGATDFLYAAAGTPDGAIVVAGGQDGLLRIWDAKTGRLLAARK
jgi:WD40 repeat protein